MLTRQVLSGEHAELARLADLLLTEVASEKSDLDRLARTRWRLHRVLAMHLAKEDNLLYPALRRSAALATRRLADRFVGEMGALADDYQAYCARWTIVAIERDWPGFQAATRGVIAALQTRIKREEVELYPSMEPWARELQTTST